MSAKKSVKPTENITLTSIDNFIKTGTPNKKDGKNFVVHAADGGWLSPFIMRKIESDFIQSVGFYSNSSKLVPDMLVATVNKKPVIVINGDARTDGFSFNTESATISLECLKQMFGLTNITQVINQLVSGKIQIIDFTNDEKKELSSRDKKIKAAGKNTNKISAIKPPEFGFTLVTAGNNRYWHRAAWICLKDSDGNFYIMGQDEGSYFCSQLPVVKEKTLTCSAALKLLTPEGANANTPRQGEWFAIKVQESDVPEVTDCVAFNDDSCSITGEVCLPVDDVKSNRHELTGYYRIAKDGTIYGHEFIISHSQHVALKSDMKSWYKIVRNTARKSVSVQGVD